MIIGDFAIERSHISFVRSVRLKRTENGDKRIGIN